jgi:ectoine hydroxylase-related dioxygenase (phytanoyl-CoA dioxygenase family)
MPETRYEQLGFRAFPEFLDRALAAECCASLDRAGESQNGKDLTGLAVFDELIVSDMVLGVVRGVLGDDFLFHHANGLRLPPCDLGKAWHHDYDGLFPWVLGGGEMCHLMFYPAGLREDTGPLEVIPRSHRHVVERSKPDRLVRGRPVETETFLGEPGLMVLVNSALWHRRRPSLSERHRYYFNLSYCQRGRIRPERQSYAGRLRRLQERPGGWQKGVDLRLFDVEGGQL